MCRILSIVLLTAALTSTSFAQNLVLDPGFEGQALQNQSIGAPWTFTPAASNSLFAIAGVFPHSGVRIARFGATGAGLDQIAQTIATSAGTSYTLSYFVSSQGASAGTPTIFQALWNGSVVTGSLVSNANNAGGVYSFFSFNVVGTGSDILAFQGRNAPSFTRLDDVSLVAQGTPELSMGGCWAPMTMVFFTMMLLQGRRRLSHAG